MSSHVAHHWRPGSGAGWPQTHSSLSQRRAPSQAPPAVSASEFLCPQKQRLTAGARGTPGGHAGGPRQAAKARRRMDVRALDAAMPFDYEHIQNARLAEQGRLKIGILGFGNFGQFLARRMLAHNHTVTAWSRSDYSGIAKSMGVKYFRDVNDFCEDHPDVVILSCSILSCQKLLMSLPLQRLRRSTLFADVLSVKVFPKALLLQVLPPGFDILCTHPMFGPESGKGSWEGLPFVFEKVRLKGGQARAERCEKLLSIFEKEGCRMVEMSCEEHDRYAAGTQFVTHTVGRVLGQLGLKSTPINTKGYETLLNLVDNTAGDSFDLYYGLFMYNTNATEELQRLEYAFDTVKKQLLDQLHSVLREQLLGTAAPGGESGGEGEGRRAPLLLSDSSQGPAAPNGASQSQAVVVSVLAEEQQ